MQRDRRQEWFRRTSWEPSDRNDFFTKLARSRGSKSQFLRIQALHLQEAAIFEPALELLDLLVSQHPDDLDLASAHLQRAGCLTALGRYDEAIEAFRDVFRQEHRFPNVRTHAWIDFGWLAIQHGSAELYEDVLKMINEQPDPVLLLPFDRYRLNAVLAVIADELGEREAARRHATTALQAASESKSGLRYHPKLGLVKNVEPDLHRRLWSLAG